MGAPALVEVEGVSLRHAPQAWGSVVDGARVPEDARFLRNAGCPPWLMYRDEERTISLMVVSWGERVPVVADGWYRLTDGIGIVMEFCLDVSDLTCFGTAQIELGVIPYAATQHDGASAPQPAAS